MTGLDDQINSMGRRRMAAHESGHATAAYVFGHSVGRICARSDEGRVPMAEHFPPAESSRRAGDLILGCAAVEQIAILLIGPLYDRAVALAPDSGVAVEHCSLAEMSDHDLLELSATTTDEEKIAVEGVRDITSHGGRYDSEDIVAVLRTVTTTDNEGAVLRAWGQVVAARLLASPRFKFIAGGLTELLFRYGELDMPTAQCELERLDRRYRWVGA